MKTETLADRTIVLGITGSIAAVRTIELAHELIRRGAVVQAVMTEPAQRIIHPDAIESATGRRVITGWTGKTPWVEYCAGGGVDCDCGDDDSNSNSDCGAADLLLIAPCTAATIGKIAHGIPDSPVSIFAVTAIGSDVPVAIAPAMHADMYNPIVRANIDLLRSCGVLVIEPVIAEGKAKIAENGDIVRWVERALGGSALAGRKVLITGGATAEPIDPVRILTSRASGRMGIELAFEAFRRGADVTLVHRGHIGFSGIREIYVESAREMTGAVLDATGSGGSETMTDTDTGAGCDVLISAAAISDYTLDSAGDKIRSGAQLTLNLRPTEKLLGAVRDAQPDLAIVGFKLETSGGDLLIERARETMNQYGLAVVVANTMDNMGGDCGDVRIITAHDPSQPRHVSGTKTIVAGVIFDYIQEFLEGEGWER